MFHISQNSLFFIVEEEEEDKDRVKFVNFTLYSILLSKATQSTEMEKSRFLRGHLTPLVKPVPLATFTTKQHHTISEYKVVILRVKLFP